MQYLHEMQNNPERSACGILGLADLNGKASHDLLSQAIQGLIRMEHRGGGLGDTGDGAGILLSPSRDYFERFIKPGRQISNPKEPLVVGTIFFLHGERNIHNLQREIDVILLKEGLMPLGWRKVPVNEESIGVKAREDLPPIYQLLLTKGNRREAELLSLLHRVRNIIEDELRGMLNVVSLSPFTTVYKALATSKQFANFYPDLKDPNFKTNVAVAHRRYSTNTFSNWNLVQPFRQISHNGEINTITANCRAVKDAECAIHIGNTLMNHGSDSAQLDRVAEMMAVNGMSGVHEAIRRMLTPAWSEDSQKESERKFFEANRRAMGTLGAWEGPIAVIGTDGKILFAALDKMGLRPLRYVKTHSNRIVISSEIGAIALAPEEIESDGQLEPGEMLLADLESGTFVPPDKTTEWIISRTGLNFENLASVDLLPLKSASDVDSLPNRALNIFGWTTEKMDHLKKMIKESKEPIVSMGNDRPLAIFSENHSRLYSYLHQIVAVVTNPPIDPIREGGAIDTTVYLGRSPQISQKSIYRSWPQYKLEHPILTNEHTAQLFAEDVPPDLKAYRLDATFLDRGGKPRDIIRRIHDLTEEALEVIKTKKASILVLSDFEATKGERLPIPMLLAVSAIHRGLAEKGLRRDASIVAQTGEVHEGHDLAILLSYGATAVNPYAMFGIAKNFTEFPEEQTGKNLVSALIHTLRKIMSKMGITTLAGYRGSALFEAIGISSEIVEYYIPDTVSKLGGVTIEQIYDDIVARFKMGDGAITQNKNISVYRRDVVNTLQLVARNGNANGDYDRFIQLLEDTPPVYLRDMLLWNGEAKPIPPDQTAGTEEIIRTTIRGAAMSYGAISGLAHRAIAAAFNHFGSSSNSGEGGEDERRNIGCEWESDRSKIRQIASGRFGVDANYLIHADEIEIKIGQGAKPGEGGHLPAKKVTPEIARIRKTKAGIDLISPPPHHDIYSIEDLAQLIRNLKELHPKAVISVKVPSITNLGTISVGIVKAGADVISISCFTGGTGAASSSSLTHGGLPLERGVSEAHQYLVANQIRKSVRIRADGGIKCGQDIAKIIALGADEVTIGTPLLISECCIFCRGCNKGNCPVGIATQDEAKQNARFMRERMGDIIPNETNAHERYLEAKNGIIRYLECLANDFKKILATLGLKTPHELVGRTDLLKQKITGNPRWDSLDLGELLLDFPAMSPSPNPLPSREGVGGRGSEKNERIVSATDEIFLSLNNDDHAIGATLAGKIAKQGGLKKDSQIKITATGYAGQGFGFAATSGMSLRLEGYANDTVAEAMGGTARITIVPPKTLKNFSSTPHLVGNAAAYGATGGTLYVAGRVGQRFGVRNSGATLVCEGAGKYAFEYMTGGIGIVLGKCGPCVGTGMTGGEIFIFNQKSVAPFLLLPEDKEKILNEILKDYYSETGSRTAGFILENWQEQKSKFAYIHG